MRKSSGLLGGNLLTPFICDKCIFPRFFHPVLFLTTNCYVYALLPSLIFLYLVLVQTRLVSPSYTDWGYIITIFDYHYVCTVRQLIIFCFFFTDIRLQLSEQLRCLDVRMEAQVTLVAELQDYFRRRAELELDYSKNLDKLAKSLQLRHKEQKQK